MGDRHDADSSLESPAVDERAIETFKLLGAEARLEILLALWDTHDPRSETNTVSFSELYDRVEITDSGQFSYHLDKLIGDYVEDVDDGYRLRNVGHQVIRTVLSGTGFEDPSLEQTDIDIDCVYCGASTVISYHDERLYFVCTECEGSSRRREEIDEPGGILFRGSFDPAGLANRNPREIYEVYIIEILADFIEAQSGICPDCSGPFNQSFELCEDHDPGPKTVCPNCQRRYQFRAVYECEICKKAREIPPRLLLGGHPAVVSFYDDHGIVVGDVTDRRSLRRAIELMWAQESELVSREPLRVRVAIRHEGDELQLTYDEELEVVSVNGEESVSVNGGD